jgi:hypothetical protein
MSRLDDALREAMRRETPPGGFAERVMARVQAAPEPRTWAGWLAAFRRPQLRWATALAAVVLVVGTAGYRNEMQKRAEGERARDQVMLALRITGGKLRMTQEAVRRIGYAPREQ